MLSLVVNGFRMIYTETWRLMTDIFLLVLLKAPAQPLFSVNLFIKNRTFYSYWHRVPFPRHFEAVSSICFFFFFPCLISLPTRFGLKKKNSDTEVRRRPQKRRTFTYSLVSFINGVSSYHLRLSNKWYHKIEMYMLSPLYEIHLKFCLFILFSFDFCLYGRGMGNKREKNCLGEQITGP